MENIAQYLIYLAFFSSLLPITTGIFYYKTLNKTLKIALLFFIVSACFDLIGYLIRFIDIRNNSPLFHFYNLFFIVFFGIIYWRSFERKILQKLTLLLLSITFIVIVTNMVIHGINGYPSFSNTVLSICFIPIALIYFYELLNRQHFAHIESDAMFWFNSGILFYFSINLFLFMLHNNFADRETRISTYMIQSVTSFITNVAFAIGLLCKPSNFTLQR